MRIILYFISLFFLLASCTFNSGNNQTDQTGENKIRKKVFKIAVKHAKEQFTDPKKKEAVGLQPPHYLNVSQIFSSQDSAQ